MSDSSWDSHEPRPPRKSFEQEVLELLADPFSPFYFVINSGERFLVSSPLEISSTPTLYIVYARNGTHRLRISAISHIDVP